MKTKFAIAQQFKKHKALSNSRLPKQYANTKTCQAFYAGDTMEYKDTIQFQTSRGEKKKAIVQFNKIKPYVNAVKGFMAQNRRKTKYLARKNSPPLQALFSQYANSISDYCRNNANADQCETQADGDTLVNGYSAIETALTYGDGYATTVPNGEIVMGRLDPLSVGWDPMARATNLLDARWVYTWKDYALSDAIELFQDSEESEFETADNVDGDEDDYQINPRGGLYAMIKERDLDWANESEKQVRVYFYQWQDIEKYYRADNPIYTLENPESVSLAAAYLDAIAAELEGQDDLFKFDPRAEILCFDEDIKTRLVAKFGKFIQPFAYRRKVYYTAVMSGKHVFRAYQSVSQQGFSIKFKTGDFDEKNKIWVGLVNSMKDPQEYYNKSLTEVMFAIAASSKGGVMYEKNSIEDIREFEKKYAKTDAACEVAAGALAEGRIKPKREGYQPTGGEQIIVLADNALADVSGIDKTFLGSSENKLETGVLQKQRIRQVISTLATYFDSITLYGKEHARLFLDFMRIFAENNSGALIHILGEDGKNQFMKLSADKLMAEYDVIMGEAQQTPEERQEQANILIQLGDKLLSAGDPAGKVVYAMAVKLLPIDEDDVQKLQQVLIPKDQSIDPAYVQQLQQQVQTLMSEITQADVKEKLSRIALNIAKLDQVKAQTDKTAADAASTIEKAHQTSLENLAMQKAGATVSINI